MPRLGQNPELLRAARLARVGPDTWESWVDAGRVPLDLLKSLVSDAPAGDLLRALGVDLPKQQSDVKALENYIVDLGLPNVPVGQIKRLSHALRKGSPDAEKLRKVMQEENRLRGKPKHPQRLKMDDDYLDSLLRSTPFHGRGYEHYPQTGEVYNPGIAKPGNIGEPQGLSMTYREPSDFNRAHHFAKRPKKYGNALRKLKKARGKIPVDVERSQLLAELRGIDQELVQHRQDLLDYGDIKTENDLLLDGKYTGMTEERAELVKKIKFLPPAAKEIKGLEKSRDLMQKKSGKVPPISRVFPRFHGRPTEKVVKGWKGSGDEEVLQEGYTYALGQMPELWKKDADGILALPPYHKLKQNMNGHSKQSFNTHLTDYLRSKGYRGVLYSPQRYGEYELRMLDPRDVVQQDIRQVDDPALKRLYRGNRSETKILKSPLTGEAETWHPSSKKSGVIGEWSTKSDQQANPDSVSGHSPYALGAIYGDINLQSLELPPEHLRKALNQEVKTRLLAEESKTLEPGLSVGKLGESRVRKDDIPEFGSSVSTQNPWPEAMEFFGVEDFLGIYSKADPIVIAQLVKKGKAGDQQAIDFLENLVLQGKAVDADAIYADAVEYIKALGPSKKTPWEVEDYELTGDVKAQVEALINEEKFKKFDEEFKNTEVNLKDPTPEEDLVDFTAIFGNEEEAIKHMKATGKKLPLGKGKLKTFTGGD